MKAASLQKGATPQPPVHVAIIMDGNGRWAHARNLPRTEGHRRGADSVRTVIKLAAEAGISYLTLFGFSSENWQRPQSEVNDLMGLLRYYLRSEISNLHKEGVRFRIIGERDRLAPDIVNLIEEAEALTSTNTVLTLTIALSYGGRKEIVLAAKSIAEAVKQGVVHVDEIDEDLFARYLFTADTPDPDLLIRTSGEQRISNFLLWQMAYAEFVFIDTLWPDFSKKDFDFALSEFHRRERRYGASGV